MNVEVVQKRLSERSQQHRKHQPQWIAAARDRVLKRSRVEKHLESRMLGNLHVRFGVGAGVQLPRLHHLGGQPPRPTRPQASKRCSLTCGSRPHPRNQI